MELLMTLAIAILFSFLVAKLVSMTTGGDIGRDSELKSTENVGCGTVTEEMKFEGGLRVQDTEGEMRVKYVGEAVKVDEFEGDSVRVHESLPMLCRDEEFVEKRWDNVTSRLLDGQSEEVRVVECGESQGLIVISDEDDWEGIERSELEKLFAEATSFVGYGDKDDDRLSSVGSDVRLQLYGLHKVALEGPCHGTQPMALKVSARAKWNVWQKLGNMSPEVAMEKYIALLSDRVPGWMEGNSSGDGKLDSSEAGICGTRDANLSTFLHHQPDSTNERRPELKCSTEGFDLTGDSNSMNRGKE